MQLASSESAEPLTDSVTVTEAPGASARLRSCTAFATTAAVFGAAMLALRTWRFRSGLRFAEPSDCEAERFLIVAVIVPAWPGTASAAGREASVLANTTEYGLTLEFPDAKPDGAASSPRAQTATSTPANRGTRRRTTAFTRMNNSLPLSRTGPPGSGPESFWNPE